MSIARKVQRYTALPVWSPGCLHHGYSIRPNLCLEHGYELYCKSAQLKLRRGSRASVNEHLLLRMTRMYAKPCIRQPTSKDFTWLYMGISPRFCPPEKCDLLRTSQIQLLKRLRSNNLLKSTIVPTSVTTTRRAFAAGCYPIHG